MPVESYLKNSLFQHCKNIFKFPEVLNTIFQTSEILKTTNEGKTTMASGDKRISVFRYLNLATELIATKQTLKLYTNLIFVTSFQFCLASGIPTFSRVNIFSKDEKKIASNILISY